MTFTGIEKIEICIGGVKTITQTKPHKVIDTIYPNTFEKTVIPSIDKSKVDTIMKVIYHQDFQADNESCFYTIDGDGTQSVFLFKEPILSTNRKKWYSHKQGNKLMDGIKIRFKEKAKSTNWYHWNRCKFEIPDDEQRHFKIVYENDKEYFFSKAKETTIGKKFPNSKTIPIEIGQGNWFIFNYKCYFVNRCFDFATKKIQKNARE